MWKDLTIKWQAVFKEAWKAFGYGSVPIGAALFDKEGQLILSDRNRAREEGTVNREISHAEANALRSLDTDRYSSYELSLYTSMEPCPMCMGMIIMGHIKNVHFAAFDAYCGMVHLTDTEPYYIGKNVTCTHEGGDMQLFQLTVQSYYELRHLERGGSDKVIRQFEATDPEAVSIARELYKDKALDTLAGKNAPCGEVYDMIMKMKGTC